MENDSLLRFITYVLTTPREQVIDEVSAYLDRKRDGDNSLDDKDMDEMISYFLKNKEFGFIFERFGKDKHH